MAFGMRALLSVLTSASIGYHMFAGRISLGYILRGRVRK